MVGPKVEGPAVFDSVKVMIELCFLFSHGRTISPLNTQWISSSCFVHVVAPDKVIAIVGE